MQTKPRYLGQSSDLRTGRWKITCPVCGNEFEPQTTRLSWQNLQCPRKKCGAEMTAYYNEEPPVVKLN